MHYSDGFLTVTARCQVHFSPMESSSYSDISTVLDSSSLYNSKYLLDPRSYISLNWIPVISSTGIQN